MGEFMAVWLWVHCRLSLEPAISLLPSLPEVTQPSHHLLQLSHLLQQQEVLYLGTPYAGRSSPVPAPGEKSRHFLQYEVCTTASPFSSSVCLEASATAGIVCAHPPQPELQPLLSDECPPFCLEGQLG